jgi:hypothetical protein
MARGRPAVSDLRLAQIRAGTLSGPEACLQLLESALLTGSGNTQISDSSNAEKKAVIQTMHNFHHSWFFNRRFQGLNDTCGDKSTGDIFDATQPAAYITRALLHPSAEYKSVVTSTQSYEPVRLDETPNVGAHSLATKVNYAYRTLGGVQSSVDLPYVKKGAVIGIQPTSSTIVPNLAFNVAQNFDLKATFGGGILGDQAYLLHTIKEDASIYKANGALKMPRKWAKGFLGELMCRELPMVRSGDGADLVSQTASAPFRKSAACIRCHVTMDRMAAVSRNFLYARTFDGACTDGTFPNAYLLFKVTPDLASGGVWPLTTDADYWRRPSEGTLYYRGYNGDLVDQPVDSLSSLGAAIANQKDFYVCAAKHYYEFFTGISADLRDIGDPAAGIVLNKVQKAHREKVISLGESLQSHQSLRLMIKDIFDSSAYKAEHFEAYK